MSSIFIKTWSCSCGYRQDCEPTQENADLHFNSDRNFPVNSLKAGECPACALKGQHGMLDKEVDPAKKSKMSFMDVAEHAAFLAALEADGPHQVSDGAEERDETPVEISRRVDKELEKLEGLSASEKAKARTDLLTGQPRKIQTNRMRDEFPHERKLRIERVKNELSPLTAQQIAELRAKHEDV